MSASCYLHPGVDATATCPRCARGICDACTLDLIEGSFCPRCTNAVKGRRDMRTLLVVGIVAVLGLAVALALFALRPDPDEIEAPMTAENYPHAPTQGDPDLELGYDYGRLSYRVYNMQKALERDPCDRTAALGLARAMNQVGNYAGTLEHTKRFFDTCGDFRKLRWKTFSAYKELREWDHAHEQVTRLIEARPGDSDYWWWRAEVQEERSRDAAAAADYRQSMATDPSHFAASRFGKLARRLGIPCEGAFALQEYVDSRDGDVRMWVLEMHEDLFAAGNCDRELGTGEVLIDGVDSAGLVAKATIGRASGNFQIDGHTAFLVVTKPFAERAGLELGGGDPIAIHVAGGTRPARVGVVPRVSIGKATATEVAVAMVDRLPEGVDGIVGLSFLWRFDREVGANGLTVRARPKSPPPGLDLDTIPALGAGMDDPG